MRWFAVGVTVLLASVATGDALACGDKFLIPSRGVRFELTPAARQQAAVLLYVNPSSSLRAVFERLALDIALRKAGYRPRIVAEADEFRRTLRESDWDVVLLDLSDGTLGGGLFERTIAPQVIVVALNPTANDLARVRKEYAAILKSPTRSQAFVDALDVAVATRHAAQAKAAKAPR